MGVLRCNLQHLESVSGRHLSVLLEVDEVSGWAT